jgi:hypothetical protein
MLQSFDKTETSERFAEDFLLPVFVEVVEDIPKADSGVRPLVIDRLSDDDSTAVCGDMVVIGFCSPNRGSLTDHTVTGLTKLVRAYRHHRHVPQD